MSTNNASSLPQDDEKVAPPMAVLLGLITDKVGAAAALFPLGIGYASYLKEAGLPAAEVSTRLAAVGFASGYALLVLALGLLFSFWGGYVCARFARERIYVSAAVLAALSGGIHFAMQWADMPLWENIVLTLLTAAIVMAGAAFGCRQGRHETISPTS